MNKIIIFALLLVLCIMIQSCATSAESVKPESDKADKRTLANLYYGNFILNNKYNQL